jgi:hypothetical protein
MKKFLVTLLMALSLSASALVIEAVPNEGTRLPLPPCQPFNHGGTGTTITTVFEEGFGYAFGWWCMVNGEPILVGIYNPFIWAPKFPPISAPTTKDYFENWWYYNVRNWDIPTVRPDLVAARQRIGDEFNAVMLLSKPTSIPPPPPPPPPPPGPTWVVASNGTLPDRPVFPVVNGKRTYSSIGRVNVSTACDCTAIKIIESTLTYCMVKPTAVSVCTLKP